MRVKDLPGFSIHDAELMAKIESEDCFDAEGSCWEGAWPFFNTSRLLHGATRICCARMLIWRNKYKSCLRKNPRGIPISSLLRWHP